MKKYTYILLFLLFILPTILLLSGCDPTDIVQSEYCCLSPMASIPFLVLAIFQMKKN